MTARPVMICTACQESKHDSCTGAPCVCAMRGHTFDSTSISGRGTNVSATPEGYTPG